MALDTNNLKISFCLSYTTFLFDLTLEAKAEVLKNIVDFLVETLTPKGHLEINWPLKPTDYINVISLGIKKAKLASV